MGDKSRRARVKATRLVVHLRIDGGSKPQLDARTAHFSQGFVENDRVVLGEPLDRHRVGDANREDLAVVPGQGGLPEPGVVRVAVDLGLDPPEHLVPYRPRHTLTTWFLAESGRFE